MPTGVYRPPGAPMDQAALGIDIRANLGKRIQTQRIRWLAQGADFAGIDGRIKGAFRVNIGGTSMKRMAIPGPQASPSKPEGRGPASTLWMWLIEARTLVSKKMVWLP
jgi:hypothetical protein